MYFGVHHGKGPVNGAVGQIKSAATRAVKGHQAVICNAREFYEFCLKKFKHNHYSPERSQEFIQELFFFEEIDRNEEEVVAVTSQKTSSFYSLRSTGEFCIVEVREVSCICEGCLYGDSAECLNKAYISNWKAINLLTGKSVVEEYYVNKHWESQEMLGWH